MFVFALNIYQLIEQYNIENVCFRLKKAFVFYVPEA